MVTKEYLLHSLGRSLGLKKGYDCGRDVLFSGSRKEDDKNSCRKVFAEKGVFKADFVYITYTGYLHQVIIRTDILSFRNNLGKEFHYCNEITGISYAFPVIVYEKNCDEIYSYCKKNGFGLLVNYLDNDDWIHIIRPKKKPESIKLGKDERFHYLRSFSKKWIKSVHQIEIGL